MRTKGGFTLISTIMVMVILSIIVAIAFSVYRNFEPVAQESVEKSTAEAIKTGVMIYFLDPQQGGTRNFPPELDSAEAGSYATNTNPFFGVVLQEPVKRDWQKLSANTWQFTPTGNTYEYRVELSGLFRLIEAPTTTTIMPPPTTTPLTTTSTTSTTTSTTTTTTSTSTTTSTTTTSTTTSSTSTTTSTTTTAAPTTTTTTTTTVTTTTTPPAPPSVVTQAATSIGRNNARLNMTYNFGGYATGQVQFKYRRSGVATWTYTAWAIRNGSGSYNTNRSGLTRNSLYYFVARLQYSGGEIEGAQLSFTTLP